MFEFAFTLKPDMTPDHIVALTKQAESAGRELVVSGIAVTAERGRLLVNDPVPARVPLIAVEVFRAGGRVVVAVREARIARSIRGWKESQDLQRPLIEHRGRDRVAGKRLAAKTRNRVSGGRVVDLVVAVV